MQMSVKTAFDRLSHGRKLNAAGTSEPPADRLTTILAELKEHDMHPAAPEPTAEKTIQHVVAEQRQAAEALLFEAYMLEERVKHEAQSADAVAQHAAASERLEQARAIERDARVAVEAAQHHLHACAAQREAAETETAELAAAVKACEARRQDAFDDARALAARIAERAATVSASGSTAEAA